MAQVPLMLAKPSKGGRRIKALLPLRWVRVKDADHPKSAVSSTGPIMGMPIRKAPSQESPVEGCLVDLQVTDKGWTAVPVTGSGCADEFEKTRKLGVESREYFLSHVKTTDAELAARLDALKKKKQSRK